MNPDLVRMRKPSDVGDHECRDEELQEAADEIERLRAALRLAERRVKEQADADCGCAWVRDDVGEGGMYDHDENCWVILADDLRIALSPAQPKEGTPE